MLKFLCEKKAFSLLGSMAVIAVISLLSVPLSLFLSEQIYGKLRVKEDYMVLNMLEQRIETALNMPFESIPNGKTTNRLIECPNGCKLDLRPVLLCGKKICFELTTTTEPLSISTLTNLEMGETTLLKLENGLKRIDITARWYKNENLKNSAQNLNLVAYKANL